MFNVVLVGLGGRMSIPDGGGGLGGVGLRGGGLGAEHSFP